MVRPRTNIGKCKIYGCKREAEKCQMCGMHYARVRTHGNPNTISQVKQYDDEDMCLINSCGEKAHTRHLCVNHYQNYVYHKKKGRYNSIEEYTLNLNKKNEKK